MKKSVLPRVGPVARLSLGLVALTLTLLMAGDWLFGFASSETAMIQEARRREGENLAAQLTVLVEANDELALGRTLQRILTQNGELRSLAVRRSDGTLMAQRGDHAVHWIAPESGRSTLEHLRVPLNAGRSHWGDVEISFAPTHAPGAGAWLAQPLTRIIVLVSVGGFLVYYAYLRRAMQFLDPSSAVPERVRKAFDTLTDALLVLDADGRIVLANKAFRQLHGESPTRLIGRRIADLDWLDAGMESFEKGRAPWERVLRGDDLVTDVRMSVVRPGGGTLELAVSCSPVRDEYGNTRGCLVSFDDLSELERANQDLRKALSEIEQSRARIKAQNEKLTHLASRDPLTGALNRRAFFEKVAGPFETALRGNGPLCCLMTDIDHFKRFNDIYGHAVGDQVIKVVVRCIEKHIREADMLCRYGGEEFCVVMPNADLEAGMAIAERIRSMVASTAGSMIRNTDVGTITSSFGIASITDGAATIEDLIEQADTALYASKKGGRNRTTAWSPGSPSMEEMDAVAAAAAAEPPRESAPAAS